MFSYSLTPADVKALIGFVASGVIIGMVSASLRIVKEVGGFEYLF